MLQIKQRNGYGEAVDLIAPGRTLGRGRVNDIVVDDESVASFHADIKVTAHRVTIEDVGSSSGTFVNGRRVVTPATLKSGDTIKVGNVELDVVDRFKDVRTVDLGGTGLVELGAGSWSLVAQTGPDKGEALTILGRMVVGRSMDCDISLFEPGLSRHHAEFLLEGDTLKIRDLDSVNGTFVNDRRVTEAVLDEGDEVRFDRLVYVVSAPK